MSLAGITLRDLEYVVAIADEGSFVAAARRCAVSQPSLSAQVRKVEAWAGGAIFERTPRRVMITAQGRRFVEQARIVLRESQVLQEIGAGDGVPFGGVLRLSAIATLGPYLFPHVLGPLRRAFPGLTIILGEGVTRRLIEELQAGDLDAILISTPIVGPGFTVDPLFREPFYIAGPQEQSPSGPAETFWQDLDPDRRLVLEDGHCLREQALAMCGDDGRRERHGTSLETLKYMVAAGEGATLVPALAVTRIDGVVYAAPGSVAFSREIALVWRTSDRRAVHFRHFAASLRRIANEQLATPTKDAPVPIAVELEPERSHPLAG